MNDVFISHSSRNADQALGVADHLAQAGVTCWISARDVPAGESYPREIMAALSGSRVFLLLLTNHSNRSAHVYREVERAANAGLPIVTLRTDDVRLVPELEYFLSTSQWIDATSGSRADYLRRATQRITELLSGSERPPSTGTPTHTRRPRWLVLVAGLAVAAVISGAIMTLVSRNGNAEDTGLNRVATQPTNTGAPAGDLRWECASPANKVVADPDECRAVTATEPFLKAAFPRLGPFQCAKNVGILHDSSGGKLEEYRCTFDGYELSFALWNDLKSAMYHYGVHKEGNYPPSDRTARKRNIGPYTRGLFWDTEHKDSQDGKPYKATFVYSTDPSSSTHGLPAFSVSVVASTPDGFRRGQDKVFNGQVVTRNDWIRARPAP